jgi:endonuclease/exonuclease/phosphatase (EEP) superfamily protein YafD
MLTFLFWNLGRRPLKALLADMVKIHKVDFVILAECQLSVSELLQSLNQVRNGFRFPQSVCKNIVMLMRFQEDFLKPTYESDRFSIRSLQLPARPEISVAVAHMPSKLFFSQDSQTLECAELARRITDHERKRGHQRTILVGDINANPFDPGVVGANALHGVMTRSVALRGARTVQGQQYSFFYNPMWNYFGDRSSGPAGTYYVDRSEHISYFWNMFDQVLIRPDLLNAFRNETLSIVTKVGGTTLVTPNGVPDRRVASDHLPLLFQLDL